MPSGCIDIDRHPITDDGYQRRCRRALTRTGALVLPQMITANAVATIVEQSAPQESEAFFAHSTHNVYLTPTDERFGPEHPANRPVVSSKGLIADDQVPATSPLRDIYNDPCLRDFFCEVLDVAELHPYADDLSSINVHYAPHGRELGWHFDNSSFAITLLLQAPDAGGHFEYVPSLRDADRGEMAYEAVGTILDGERPVRRLRFDPGDIVLFRGRNSLHRVTPTEGATTRILAVLAYNDRPGISLSVSALETFYGRTR